MTAPSLLFAFYLLLTSSLVLYVYRFPVGGVNLSAFRLLLLGWLAWLARDVWRGRIRVERRHWPFLAVLGAIIVVNAVDFTRLGGYGALRRDIANHLLNLAFAGLVAVYVNLEARRVALLQAFVLSSVVTTAISVYSAVTNRLPLEHLIRALGPEHARKLSFISDDTVIERATAAFFDPNFYGVYSLLVVLAIVYLWLFHRPSRWLAGFFVVNLVCLAFTLSRTSLVGFVWAMGLTFLLSRRSRVFAVVASIAAVGLLYGATTLQSHQARKELAEEASAAWAYWTTPDDASGTADARGPGNGQSSSPTGTSSGGGIARGGSRPSSSGSSLAGLSAATSVATTRVADGKSLEGRVAHIRHGVHVFKSSPVFGGGSAALLVGQTGNSSAHVSYLTLLARYGIVGALVYIAFLLYPFAVVWTHRAPAGHRFLVTVALGTLMVVYLGYDVLLFFEVQYLFFGLMYSMAFEAAGGQSGQAGA